MHCFCQVQKSEMYYTYTKSQPVNVDVRKKWKKQQKKLAKKAPKKLSRDEERIKNGQESLKNKDLLCSGYQLRVCSYTV